MYFPFIFATFYRILSVLLLSPSPAELPPAVSFGCMAPQKTRQDFSRRVFYYFYFMEVLFQACNIIVKLFLSCLFHSLDTSCFHLGLIIG